MCDTSTVEKLEEGRTKEIPDNEFKCYDLFPFSLGNNKLSDMNDSIRLDKSLDDSINKSIEKAIDQYSLKDIRAGKPSPKKKIRKEILIPIVFAEVETKEGKQKTARCLIDSGGGRTLMSKKFVGKLKVRQSKKTRYFQTIAGLVESNTYVNTEFTLLEFTDAKKINYKFQLTDNLGNYDIILGRDFMTELSLEITYVDNCVNWDNLSVPLKQEGCDQSSFFIREER